MLTIADKRYVTGAIKASHDSLKGELTGEMASLREEISSVGDEARLNFGLVMDQIKHDGQLTRELLGTRPTREEVKEMIHFES